MRKSLFAVSLLILLLLSGCSETQDIAPGKDETPIIVKDEAEQRKQEEERERERMQQMNQDVINTWTVLIPAIM